MISSDSISEECLAYQWWNSQIPHLKNINQPPEVVLPNEAHGIWSKICPIFLLFVIDEQDVRTYWESIQTIVNMFISGQTTAPNPISHFPEFIQVVYTYQDILVPKTVDCCIYFIRKFGFHNAAHFILYQSPVFFLDPLLYFETLLELRSMHHFLWNDFVTKSFLVDAFFEMYSSFLLPLSQEIDDEVCAHRILICEVFYSLIQDSYDHHPNIVSIINKFLDSSINLVSSSPNDHLFPIYRTIFSTFDLIERKNIISNTDLSSRSIQLFESSSQSSSIYLTYKHLYSKQYITSLQVLTVISQKGITSLSDLTILSEMTDPTVAIPMLLFLVRSAICSHLWHRSCFSLIRQFLAKNWGARQDVRELVQVVVRRLILWVSFASMRRRYNFRQLLLCESLSMLCECRLIWLQQAILSAAVSIVASSKPSPVYFKSFFQTAGQQVDDVALHEWDLFAQSAKLKTFPFDATSGMLIMPPPREAAAIARSSCCLHRGQVQSAMAQSSSVGQPSRECPLATPIGGTFSVSKKIKFQKIEPRKVAAASALALHSPFAACESSPSSRCQSVTQKSKAKQKSAINAAASFTFAKGHFQSQAKKGTPPLQGVIKRPESAIRVAKSQSEIRISSRRKDTFLP